MKPEPSFLTETITEDHFLHQKRTNCLAGARRSKGCWDCCAMCLYLMSECYFNKWIFISWPEFKPVYHYFIINFQFNLNQVYSVQMRRSYRTLVETRLCNNMLTFDPVAPVLHTGLWVGITLWLGLTGAGGGLEYRLGIFREGRVSKWTF